MKSFFKNPYWSFVGATFGVFAYFFPYPQSETLNGQYTIWIIDSVKWTFIIGAFIFAVYAYRRPINNDSIKVLRDMAMAHKNDKMSFYGLGKFLNNGGIPVNEKWQELINQLLKATNRKDLEPHNFGDHYFLYDVFADKRVEFPQDKSARMAIIGNTIPLGKILWVMPKDS